jgi:hypothetical protein
MSPEPRQGREWNTKGNTRAAKEKLTWPVVKIGIAVTASAVLSAGAASLLMAGGSGSG